jgi:hypothetical protein
VKTVVADTKNRGNPDNMPDTLESQLDVLKKTGFKDVDAATNTEFSVYSGAVSSYSI